jgi:hypothetical protein
MERRTFVTGAVSLLAAPLAAEAKQAGKVYASVFSRQPRRPRRRTSELVTR